MQNWPVQKEIQIKKTKQKKKKLVNFQKLLDINKMAPN